MFGGTRQFDVNAAPPAVLATIGVPPEGIAALVDRRRTQPFVLQGDLAPYAAVAGAGFSRLRVGRIHYFHASRSTARVPAYRRMANFRTCIALLVRW